MSRLVSRLLGFWCDISMGVLGQLDLPKFLGQEVRVASTSVLQTKRQWFTRRRPLLSVWWKVGPPLNSLPARTGGRVSASEAAFVRLSGLTLPTALKKSH